jgi:ATP-citrate lyase beta-subunit
MAQRGIREFNAKKLLAKFLKEHPEYGFSYEGKIAIVVPETSFDELVTKNPWLNEERLVVKPDMLFGKRGKHGLVLLNATFEEAEKWINEKMSTEVKVNKTNGALTHFLIEPFISHDKEYYIAIRTKENGDAIYFSQEGGIDIEENWEHVKEFFVPINKFIDEIELNNLNEVIKKFIKVLYKFFVEYDFTYLEINPFAIIGKEIVPLDFVARLDDTAFFKNSEKWGNIEFPTPFGRNFTKEEEFIRKLDEKTGASLKLTILNPKGHVWLMVAGGGASVIFTDTVVDLGFGSELANYGEYSGDPSEEETYQYAKTILDLMTRNKDTKEKVLIIGGGIANFTDVAKTFKGIITALKEYKDKLKENNVKIFVRRGGPNYQKGLASMRKLGEETGIPIEVYGPELHMTRVVKISLGGEK